MRSIPGSTRPIPSRSERCWPGSDAKIFWPGDRWPEPLLNEMLSGEIAGSFEPGAKDVTAVVKQRDLLGTSDEELLVHATGAGRLLVTANVRDFAAIHVAWSSRGRSHAGLIYFVVRVFRSDRSFVGAIVTALDETIATGQLPVDGAETYLHRRRPEARPR